MEDFVKGIVAIFLGIAAGMAAAAFDCQPATCWLWGIGAAIVACCMMWGAGASIIEAIGDIAEDADWHH